MNEKISVIVPVYNTREYVAECIESIINQTYKNLDIILIDDGSTDGSNRILDEYALIDNRIRVIHKDNGGVSSARNVGVQNALGTYIGFVDSDDTLSSDYFEILINGAKHHNSDIVICISNIIDKNYSNTDQNNTDQNYEVYTREEGIEHLLASDKFSYGINKLYKSSLWTNFLIPEDININEDLITNYYLFNKTDKLLFINKRLYNYRWREGSASRSGFNLKQLDIIKANKLVLDEVLKNKMNKKIVNYAEKKYFNALNYVYKCLILNNEFIYMKKTIEREIQKNIILVFKNPYIKFAKKIEIVLQGYFPPLYRIVLYM